MIPPCFVCGNAFKGIDEPTLNAPIDGVAFGSLNHYGSKVWDGSTRHPERLEINVCDSCLQDRKARVVYVEIDTETTYTYSPWIGL